MLGVIISGHGGFATGMEKAMLQIIGMQEQTVAIDFPIGATSEGLKEAMLKALEKVDTGEGVVFLTDLLGGTPFRTASTIALEHKNAEVITGCNLQMILESLLERDELSSDEFITFALEAGHRGLTSLSDEFEKKKKEKASETEEDDGI